MNNFAEILSIIRPNQKYVLHGGGDEMRSRVSLGRVRLGCFGSSLGTVPSEPG